MSALAMILAKNGYSISGSDQKRSAILQELEGNYIKIFKSIILSFGNSIGLSMNPILSMF